MKKILYIVLLTVGLPYLIYMLFLRKKWGLVEEKKYKKVLRKAAKGRQNVGLVIRSFIDGFKEK
jgi:hypothetical protein